MYNGEVVEFVELIKFLVELYKYIVILAKFVSFEVTLIKILFLEMKLPLNSVGDVKFIVGIMESLKKVTELEF